MVFSIDNIGFLKISGFFILFIPTPILEIKKKLDPKKYFIFEYTRTYAPVTTFYGKLFFGYFLL